MGHVYLCGVAAHSVALRWRGQARDSLTYGLISLGAGPPLTHAAYDRYRRGARSPRFVALALITSIQWYGCNTAIRHRHSEPRRCRMLSVDN